MQNVSTFLKGSITAFSFGFSVEIIRFVTGGRGSGYFGVKRIGMTVGNPRKLP